jgi:streptogramin lyase
MRSLIRLIAAGMLACSAFAANAESVAYGEAFDTLYRIDLDTRVATSLGSAGRSAGTPIVNISGLATSSDGTLYAVAGGLKLLLRLDPTSGAGTAIGSLGLAGQGSGQFDALDLGMTSDCDGNFWLVSGVLQQLWKVDPKTGATTRVGATGHAISGLVERKGVLYGSGSRDDHGFYRIDETTGAATLIGDFGPAASSLLNSVSMSFDAEGVLWAVLNYVPPTTGNEVPDWSDLAKVDPAMGTMTVVGSITGPDSLKQSGMKGFVITPAQCIAGSAPAPAPIGSPLVLGMMGLLLAVAGARRAHRTARPRR